MRATEGCAGAAAAPVALRQAAHAELFPCFCRAGITWRSTGKQLRCSVAAAAACEPTPVTAWFAFRSVGTQSGQRLCVVEAPPYLHQRPVSALTRHKGYGGLRNESLSDEEERLHEKEAKAGNWGWGEGGMAALSQCLTMNEASGHSSAFHLASS